MAGGTPVRPSGVLQASGGLWRRLIADPLRAAVLMASAWALGTILLTALGLVVQVRQFGWQGLAAPLNLLPALALAGASFLLRLLRWHLLARRIAPALGLRDSFVVGSIGFALILTPGRIGEAMKLLLLRQRTAVPLPTSAPLFLLEKISEGAGLALVALGASLFLPRAEAFRTDLRLGLLVLALLGLGLLATFEHRAVRWLPRLPTARALLARPRLAAAWQDLVRGGDRLLTWPAFGQTLGLSLAARTCDGVAVYFIAGLYGVELHLAAGLFILGSAGFLGGVSMMPGGAGVVEAALVGLFLAFGAGPAAATAAALTARSLILWLWVALGLALAVHFSVSLDRARSGVAARGSDRGMV